MLEVNFYLIKAKETFKIKEKKVRSHLTNDMHLVKDGYLELDTQCCNVMKDWDFVDHNIYLLRTWSSICLSVDYIQNTAELYVNGEKNMFDWVSNWPPPFSK